MPTMRTYSDGCAAAHALDLVGERWALLIVRELILGPKRFTDLRGGLPHASPNILSQRLRELQRAGVVARRALPPPAASRVYALTEWGRELEEIVIALGRWGVRSPSRRPDDELGADSLVLGMRTTFDPLAAEGLTAVLELRFGERRFSVRVAEGRLEASCGDDPAADLIVTTDAATLADVIWRGRGLDEAVRSGDMALEGDPPLMERLLAVFPLPEPVERREAAVGGPP